MFGQERKNETRDLVVLLVQGEVAGVEQVDLGVRKIALERLRTGSDERGVHDDRYESGQDRCRRAKLHHLTYRARKVPQLSPAENQKQRGEKKTGRKNERIVDAVYHEKSRGTERSQSR